MALLIFCLSLLFIPLATPISLPFFPVINDLWQTKDLFVLIFATAIILLTPTKRSENPWLVALMIFLPISIYSAPQFSLIYGTQNMAGLWMWRSLAWCMLYFGLYQALGGLSYNREKTQKMIAGAICWGAIISAAYALLQAIGLDQYQTNRSYFEVGHPAAMNIVAHIGNATYLSVYIGICLPFVVLYMRWYWIILVIIPIIICQSDFGFYGTILTMGLLFCIKMDNRKHTNVVTK